MCYVVLYRYFNLLQLHACSHTHLLTPPTRKCSPLKLVASELPPNVLTTHLWPTVVQHTAAHARYVTHALRPKGGEGTQVFSVGTAVEDIIWTNGWTRSHRRVMRRYGEGLE